MASGLRRRATRVHALGIALALGVVTCAGPPDVAGEAGAFTRAEKLALLADHNARRSRLARGEVAGQPAASDMNQLFWDDGLAAVARGWAQRCQWRHNTNARNELDPKSTRFHLDAERAPVGENLYATSAKAVGLSSFTAAHDAWWNEQRGYDFSKNSCKGSCGHYTQMAAAETRYVGCAFASCPKVAGAPSAHILYVCNYFPAGNLIGQKPYAAGKACSLCDSDRRSCEKSLCSGCMAPGFAFCSDRASNCASLAKFCPADCKRNSAESLCQSCRATCGSCPAEWLEPKAQCSAVP